MGIGIRSAAVASSREISGEGTGSSPRVEKGKSVGTGTNEPSDFREPVCSRSLTAAERRAVALSASIERVLIDASERASEHLKVTCPKFSAATVNRFANWIPLLFVGLAIAAIFTARGIFVLSIVVVLPTAFRLFVVAQENPKSEDVCATFPDTPDEELPVYSVIAPLHRESRVVHQLLSAIERLDYPIEKLDVILVVETDESETRAAITARRHRIPITVIPAPPAGPRTKPKALSLALPFARGTYTVIYDAEDRPDSNQLRCAVQTFRSAGNDLACVQARLCMDTSTSWLARYFTAEYAGHFDFFLPKLAAFRMPLPLGGSSNHFRTATLREVGGWDPYNVTEDADLGMRLARLGYRCGVIDSTTYEEAPADMRRWLGQRTRWFKGWMQTWLGHMRRPRQLLLELGFRDFISFQFIVGGNALVALAHPVFLIGLLWDFLTPTSQTGVSTAAGLLAYYFAAAAFGYFVSASFSSIGLWRRGLLTKAPVLLLTPIHWLLLSVAAWLAAFELIRKPHFWNKTEHGVEMTRSLLELERHLTKLKLSGRLPQIWNDAKDSVANRRRLPRAAV